MPGVPHITGLWSAHFGFVPVPIIGSVQGQDRREPNTCGGVYRKRDGQTYRKKIGDGQSCV